MVARVRAVVGARVGARIIFDYFIFDYSMVLSMARVRDGCF